MGKNALHSYFVERAFGFSMPKIFRRSRAGGHGCFTASITRLQTFLREYGENVNGVHVLVNRGEDIGDLGD
jgi:hypothetical protein